ncbi:B12-binding domain-containing radical SAM protein [Pelobacter propionicus]|uniref:Radical SAM domain protein n=1 Tax=Pelobacter propionicus (strain DSM 2379 / NBRC 103807 / OttBd1) TaxID=338966 RepID=A1ALM5_PELPD|nr:B12-binding domain-containing radical SAM protein [Pelobacter propionicus]ABK98245.1 Radical SAM domain protein [Pelobacter propionicus DSM 2379]
MKLLLTTLHAKYSHASLALPCLTAACGDLADLGISIREWTVNEPRQQLLRRIMAGQADAVAFSCYIWNIESSLKLADDIKKIAPHTRIILGGPEASFGIFQLMHDNPAVDFVVRGEGEAVFRSLMETLLRQRGSDPSSEKDQFQGIENLFYRWGNDILSGPLATGYLEMDSIPSPFQAGLVDLSKPLIYYETSRGCPFSCAFCLSSLEGRVRSFSMERIESDLVWLMSREIQQIKLVDRTFNYDGERANRIWELILANNRTSRFHFEIAADLLTDRNMEILRRVPPRTFGFEIGVQSFRADSLEQVQRRSNLERLAANVRRLRAETVVELHLDLLAGLPGESYDGLLDSLDRLAELKPHVIQIEPLKLLKGSAMRTIARDNGYRFSQSPPYTILTTPWLSFDDIGRIETIGRLLDLFYNRGGFGTALAFMQRHIGFSQLFHLMAGQPEGDDLTGRTIRRTFELFASLAAPLLPEQERELLYDTLFFDYCRVEMPLMGKLPSFAADRQQQCSWPGRAELPSGIELPTHGRVRAFRSFFQWDYRNEGWKEEPTAVTFVYASAAGQGLQVRVL